MRKGWYFGGVAQAGALRKAERQEKEKSDRGEKARAAARTPFLLTYSWAANLKMELKAGLQEAAKAALKSRDTVKLSTLRLLLAAVHNEEIRLRKELGAEEIQKVIATLSKQRSEAIELYRKGGRDDLAQKEEAELEILQAYLPQPLTEQEVQTLIRESIAELGATGVQDLGKVMKQVMPKVSGRTDGKRVNELAKALLGG